MHKVIPIRVQVGAFELDLKAGELRKDGSRTRLQEQSLQILLMLVERSGEVVTRIIAVSCAAISRVRGEGTASLASSASSRAIAARDDDSSCH